MLCPKSLSASLSAKVKNNYIYSPLKDICKLEVKTIMLLFLKIVWIFFKFAQKNLKELKNIRTKKLNL